MNVHSTVLRFEKENTMVSAVWYEEVGKVRKVVEEEEEEEEEEVEWRTSGIDRPLVSREIVSANNCHMPPSHRDPEPWLPTQ